MRQLPTSPLSILGACFSLLFPLVKASTAFYQLQAQKATTGKNSRKEKRGWKGMAKTRRSRQSRSELMSQDMKNDVCLIARAYACKCRPGNDSHQANSQLHSFITEMRDEQLSVARHHQSITRPSNIRQDYFLGFAGGSKLEISCF